MGRDLSLSVHGRLSVHFKNVYWVLGRRAYAELADYFPSVAVAEKELSAARTSGCPNGVLGTKFLAQARCMVDVDPN